MTTNEAASISQFEDKSVNNHGRLQALELTPNNSDEEEMAVLSPRVMLQPRTKYKLLPMVLFVAMAVFAVALFASAIVPQNPNSQPQQSSSQPLQEQEQEEASSFSGKDFSSSPTIPPNNGNTMNTEEQTTTSTLPSAVVVENDPFPKCPPPSTKPLDVELLESNLGSCHKMECIAEVPLRNTRDRLAHSVPLCSGQALCNQDEERFPNTIFQFGLSPGGYLIWQQCNFQNVTDNKILYLWEYDMEEDRLVFQMTPTATWQVHLVDKPQNTSTLVWEHAVQHQPRPIQVTPQCLSDHPVLDCPYLHFRRHGDIVMNYVDPQDGWVACKSRKICYADLWEGK